LPQYANIGGNVDQGLLPSTAHL